jgi:hypothetical protein
MKTPEISFLSGAQIITLSAYKLPQESSIVASEVIGRIAAAILLSTAAALDLVFHSLLVLPTFIYAIGQSIYLKQADFTIPWQHLQRIQNAVAPLLLGSAFGLIHPLAGLWVSEPTDKHAVMGMLSSNTCSSLETPCSPIHSLSIVENLARRISGEIFSAEHIKVLTEAKELEGSLEVLQVQEWIHKITNLTLFVMAHIKTSIESSYCGYSNLLVRVSGLLIPLLTAVDLAIALLAQAFFLVTGIVRFISGRGPTYTEVTVNPLMHVLFLIQNILKAVGNLVGTLVWFVSPMTGFRVSLAPANLFFKLQMKILMSQIKGQLQSASENSRFAIPILFGNGEASALSIPSHSMHKTYLIVEKQNGKFNLYWVNRPNISHIQGQDTKATLTQIRSMLDERFPFMDTEKLMNYPVRSNEPKFLNSTNFATIASQGGRTNCVVSNLFGMLETLDRLRGEKEDITQLRYKIVRESLMKDYEFYKHNFSPLACVSNFFTLGRIWQQIRSSPNAAI